MIETRQLDEWTRIVTVLERARGHDHVAQLDPEQADITEDEIGDGAGGTKTLMSFWFDATVYGRDGFGNVLEAVLDGGIVRTIVFNGAGEELQRRANPLAGHAVFN
jgi:hypothetical protein